MSPQKRGPKRAKERTLQNINTYISEEALRLPLTFEEATPGPPRTPGEAFRAVHSARPPVCQSAELISEQSDAPRVRRRGGGAVLSVTPTPADVSLSSRSLALPASSAAAQEKNPFAMAQ